MNRFSEQKGATLIEIVVFIVILGVALAATLKVFNDSVVRANDPLIRVRALELAQAQLDDILSRKFDENTPTGGVPACDSAASGAPSCAGIVPDGDFDDVGDFQGFEDLSHTGYRIFVSVEEAGTDLGIPESQARLITVQVSTPATSAGASGIALTLAAYKVNF